MDFPARLLDLRQEKELTQNQLAELVNISRSALSLYELGKREPDFETLQKLADFFNVSVDYLLGRSEIRNSESNTGTALVIGKSLRELRTEKDLSQTELGKVFNLSKQTISSYENGGSNPDPELLDRLATFFDVSVDYLLGRTDIRKFDLNIENIAAMRSKELEGYDDLPDEAKKMLQAVIKEYYERFGKKKGKPE